MSGFDGSGLFNVNDQGKVVCPDRGGELTCRGSWCAAYRAVQGGRFYCGKGGMPVCLINQSAFSPVSTKPETQPAPAPKPQHQSPQGKFRR
jgi:hypothetical protein